MATLVAGAAALGGLAATGVPLSAGDPDATAPSAASIQVAADVPALRTRTSQTVVGAGGAHQTRIALDSVNYRDAAGRWQPIDNSLVRDGDVVRNAANRYALTLPRALGSAPIRMTHGAASVTVAPRGATGHAVTSGAAVTYANAWPGVDLRYTATGDSVREAMIVQDRASVRDFEFGLSVASGSTLRREANGGVLVQDAAGARQFRLLPSTMVDAAGSVAPAEMALARDGGDWTLRVVPDREWLDAPQRRWPVVVDPTVTVADDPSCGMIYDEVDPLNQSPCLEDLLVGEACTDICKFRRVVARFDVNAMLPPKAVVTSASVDFGTAEPPIDNIEVRRLTTDWDESVDWFSWVDPGAYYDSADAANLTSVVRGWALGDFPNYGLLFMMPTNGIHTEQAIDPQLTVDYVVDTTPPTVTLSGPLKDEEGQPLTDAAYRLHIESSDAHAGVGSIKVYVDNVLKATLAPSAGDFDFVTAQYADGTHTVRVDVADRVGNVTSSTVAANNAQSLACRGYAREEDFCSHADRDDDDEIADIADLGPDGAAYAFDEGEACLAVYVNPYYCDISNLPPDEDESPFRLDFATPGYGIADEHWERFTQASFTDLAARYVKKIVPFDIVDNPTLYADWKHYYEHATAAHDEILVVFGRTNTPPPGETARNYAPTYGSYKAKVSKFLNENPLVNRVSAWNEPNESAQPTRRGTKKSNKRGYGERGAAGYTRQLVEACRERGEKENQTRCRLVIGEFAADEKGKWKSYVREYKRQLGSTADNYAHWSIHPYNDVQFTRQLSKSDVKAFADLVPEGAQIWLTEVGSRTELMRGTATYPDETAVENRQALETTYLYDNLATINGVRRVYYYSMCEPLPDNPGQLRQDSGLLGRGNCATLRPAWHVVKARMNP